MLLVLNVGQETAKTFTAKLNLDVIVVISQLQLQPYQELNAEGMSPIDANVLNQLPARKEKENVICTLTVLLVFCVGQKTAKTSITKLDLKIAATILG